LALPLLFLCVGFSACGGGGGSAPTPPVVQPPQQTTVERIRELAGLLRGMTLDQAVESTELSEFVQLVAQEGTSIVTSDSFISDSEPGVRIGAIRAMVEIGPPSFPESIVVELEARLAAETEQTILDEVRLLVLDVYELAVSDPLLSFSEAIEVPEYAKLVDLLITTGETAIVDGGWLNKTIMAVRFAGVSAFLKKVTFQEVLDNGTALTNFVNILAGQNSEFIVNQTTLTDVVDSIRLGAVRALGIIHAQFGLPASAISILESRSNGPEQNTIVLGEIRVLLLNVYDGIVGSSQLTFDQASNTPEFAKLTDLLVSFGEGFVLSARWLGNVNDALRFAGVRALSAINDLNGSLSSATIERLRMMFQTESNGQVFNVLNTIVREFYLRNFNLGIQSRFDISVGLAIEGGEASSYESGRAAIASMYIDDDMIIARAYLNKFKADFDAAAPFSGFAFAYDTSGDMAPGRGGQLFPSTIGTLTVGFTALHYTVLSDDQTYLPMIFGIVDWLESRPFSPGVGLLSQAMTGFADFDRPVSIIVTAQNLIARGYLDELDLFLTRNPTVNNSYPGRQTALQSFATELHEGIESHLWIGNRYILVGERNNNGDEFTPWRLLVDGSLLFDSFNFPLPILQAGIRSLPNGYGTSDLMSDAVATFGVSLDIDGYTIYELGSPFGQDIPQIDRTAFLASAFQAVGDNAQWQSIVGQLYGQGVEVAEGGMLMPDATRPYDDLLTVSSYSGQENPKVGPTGFFALTALGLGIHPYMIPSPEQIAALRAAQ